MSPTFDKDVTTYTTATSNASNKVTATPEDVTSTIEVKLGSTVIENGSSPTWETGENTVTVKVTDRNDTSITKTYTVTITKS